MPDATVTDLIEGQAARSPDAVAVVARDGVLTYAELASRADRLASSLRAEGVGPDVVVAVFAERSLDMAVGLWAILKAGGACLTLDISAPAERVAFMLHDSQVPVVLTQRHLGARLADHRARVVWLEEWAPETPAPGAAGPGPAATPDHLAYLVYTSGSTGRPKGVMLPHGALVSHHRAVRDLYQLQPGDRVLQFCSVSFDVSIEEMFPTWSAGATVVLRDDTVPVLGRPWLQWLRDQRVTMLNLPTAYWHQWVRDLQAIGGRVPDDIRLVTVGGEKALGQAYRTWLSVAGEGIRWINAYGPAEASIMATYFEPAAKASELGWTDPPIGRPIANTTVHVLDADGVEVPAGTLGELHIGGLALARGYINQPELTAQRFIPDPFSNRPGARLYRSGDLVRWRGDANLEFVGRNDQQVKIRGFRIECAEVEAALMAHPAVSDVAVIGREDSPGVKRLVGYVVPASGEVVAPAELRKFLSEHLPQYMVPTAFVVLAAFPTSPNGKVDRQRLPAPDQSDRHLDPESAPGTLAEKVLAAIWERVLGVDFLGIDEDFFELGGHSLMAIQVIAEAREAFGIELGLSAIFEFPTVRGLAGLIGAAAVGIGDRYQDLPPLVAHDRALEAKIPLSVAQEQMWRLEAEAAPPGLYNVTVQHRMAPADPDRLHAALSHLVARHEALRTRFVTAGDQVFQTVAPSVSFDLPATDLRAVAEHEREHELLRRVAGEDARPFVLDRAPLFRAHLFHVDGGCDLLTVTFDHMISDGTSAFIFLTELDDVYAALSRNERPALRPLPVQFADFALWQRSWLTDDRQQAQLDYWKQTLQGMPLGPALRFDHLPTTPTRRIASRDLTLPLGAYQRLKRLARSTQSTMFIVSAATVVMALSLLGQSDDIVLSTTMSGRQRGELEGVLGFFAGIGRIRADLSGDPTVDQVLARVREAVLGLFDHQDLPFMRIRDVVVPEFPKLGGGTHPLALLPVEFQYFHAGQDGWAPGLGVVEQPGVDKGPDQLFFRGQLHPLSITLLDDGARLWGEISYKVDFYRPETIERLARGIERLLGTLSSSTLVALADLRPIIADDGSHRHDPPPLHRPVGSWPLDG